jgi:hypothetical protein
MDNKDLDDISKEKEKETKEQEKQNMERKQKNRRKKRKRKEKNNKSKPEKSQVVWSSINAPKNTPLKDLKKCEKCGNYRRDEGVALMTEVFVKFPKDQEHQHDDCNDETYFLRCIKCLEIMQVVHRPRCPVKGCDWGTVTLGDE